MLYLLLVNEMYAKPNVTFVKRLIFSLKWK